MRKSELIVLAKSLNIPTKRLTVQQLIAAIAHALNIAIHPPKHPISCYGHWTTPCECETCNEETNCWRLTMAKSNKLLKKRIDKKPKFGVK